METMDLQSNLAMMKNIEFEEKVDIDDLVFPSKPMKSAEIEINDIKQETLEEEKKDSALKSDHDESKKFKLKMEENILKLFEELDKDKYDHPTTNFRCSTCVL
jgi:hypothetical protein